MEGGLTVLVSVSIEHLERKDEETRMGRMMAYAEDEGFFPVEDILFL